jgi:hypothetical protein
MPDTVQVIQVDPAIRFFQSTLIRRAAGLLFLGAVKLLMAAGVTPVIFGINLASWRVDQVADAIMGTAAIAFAGYSIRKRIKDGKDPQNPAPVIEPPAVVDAVKRLTGG